MTALSGQILDASTKVHKSLGPGLLESVYQNCLAYELEKKGLKIEKEVIIPVTYDKLFLESGFRADMIVENKIIVELKLIEKIMPIHKAQTFTYLKLSNYPLALLVNFGEILLKDGFHRFANGSLANDL